MERILIVEDDRFFREMYYHLLRGEGYKVDTVSSPEEAIDNLMKTDYQLVITDLVMPGMSGIDLLFRVKQLNPDIDVILVTSSTNLETAVFALKNGARDYLVKPINSDEFKHIVSLCLEQRRLLNENIELKGLVHLFQVGQTISNCLELDRLYTLIVDTLAKEVGSGKVLGLFTDNENRLNLLERRGFNEQESESLVEIMLPDCLRYEGTACDLKRLDAFFQTENRLEKGLRSELHEALILFIRSKTTLQGVVILFNNPGGTIHSDINYKNLTFILDQSSLAFENATRYATAKNLLYIDELTTLYNYRYLDIALEQEIKRSERYGTCLTVIFLDLDFFKNVNDTHGHLVGSSILKEIGKILKMSVREIDLVIRYGGDEYTIILVETSSSGGALVAERIRSTIANYHFLSDQGYAIRLTACLGYASYPDDTKLKQRLLDLADQAMYRGKSSGRNRVFHALENK
ncbi:MAG: diguanylate cyclase [Deltaproteobacteria bacterium]